MAQSIRNTVKQINEALALVLKGAKYYGLATLVTREGKDQPVVDDHSVTFDDSFPMQIYHRITGNMAVTYTAGFGDNDDVTNTFAMSAFVFNNEKRTGLKTDEVAMIFQSALAVLNINATITPTAFILNSQSVFGTEYRGSPYSLNEYQSLMQMNYTVEIVFPSRCFNVCPEDFSTCAAETST